MTANPGKSFVFVFPMASGHVNPSLPIARSLVKLGHEVHYVCAEEMRAPIEDTGAIFHSEREVETEFYSGRPEDMMEVFSELHREHGLEEEPFMLAAFKLKLIRMELALPGLIRFFHQMKPSAVLYCPHINMEAAWAAKHEGIPHIALNTMAGPAARVTCLEQFAKHLSLTLVEFDEKLRAYQPNLDAVQRMRSKYGVDLEGDGGFDKPFGRMQHLRHAALTLVTTTEDFYDPINPELQKSLEKDAESVAVGPLLDVAGAKRAAGHKSTLTKDGAEDVSAIILDKATSARRAGRKVILASMGTAITSDVKEQGWDSRPRGKDGQPRGLSGRELCRAAWAGVFEAFGSDDKDAPLLLVSLGPQANALGDLVPPANALCAPVLPQVDLLKAGVDLFLTHGGQNSFTEALANSVPLLVCPGFGDQFANAQRAVDAGVGLKVDRPDPDAGQEAQATAAYSSAVRAALLDIFDNCDLKVAATRCAENLQRAGGVPRAVQLVLAAAQGKNIDVTRITQGGA